MGDVDFSPLAQAAAPFILGASDALAWGQYYSIACNEDVRFIPKKLIEPMTRGGFAGRMAVDDLVNSCARWPKADVPAGYRKPVRSKPVMIISGELDPVAGEAWGAHVAQSLPNSLHLIVPGAAHLPPLNECTSVIVSGFLQGAALGALDTSCVKTLAKSVGW